MWAEWLRILPELAAATLRRPDAVLELLEELKIMADASEKVAGRRYPHIRRASAISSSDAGRPRVRACIRRRHRRSSRACVFGWFDPGLNEGDFPRLISGDPLLADDRKRALGLAGGGRNTGADLLRTALACASQRVIASYSEVDLLSGRKRVLSLYAAELMKAARGSALDIRASGRRGRECAPIRGGVAGAKESAGCDRRCRI